ncbi:hypothetical protein VTI74DRAFT_9549 [Chaetomium olivicolor]
MSIPLLHRLRRPRALLQPRQPAIVRRAHPLPRRAIHRTLPHPHLGRRRQRRLRPAAPPPTLLPSPSSPTKAEHAAISDEEVANELLRVRSTTTTPGTAPTNGLRVINLAKIFNRTTTAVDNVTFDVPHGEVFALLGPNGAGKSTTISVIRGDLKPSGGPSGSGGDVFVESASVTRHPAAA